MESPHEKYWKTIQEALLNTKPDFVMQKPPCEHCAHWHPQVKFRPTKLGFMQDGVRLCHADEMFPDFSCFRQPKEIPF